MNIKSIAVIAGLLLNASLGFAQSIQYVSYFPVPYASHENLSVSNLAILAAKGSKNNEDLALMTECNNPYPCSIEVGNASSPTRTLAVADSFSTYDNMVLYSATNSSPASGVDLAVKGGSTSSTAPTGVGTVSSKSNIVTGSVLARTGSLSLSSLVANNEATVRGVKWGSNGGLGFGSGVTSAPSYCSGNSYSWVSLKLDGGEGYKTYLTCGNTAGTSTCSGCTPGDTKTVSCPAGYTGYAMYTCSSSCQWVLTNNNCTGGGTSGCTDTYTATGSPVYMTNSEAVAADTCEGNPSHQYVCQGVAKQCVDAVIVSGGGYTQLGKWAIDYRTASSVPSGNCEYSTTNSLPSPLELTWFTDATAVTTCKQQCYAIGVAGYGTPCDTSCDIVKSSGSYNSGWETVYNYYKFSLTCTRQESKPYVVTYNVNCCGS